MTVSRSTQSTYRPIPLRIGLILAAVLTVGGALPAVLDIGFDGSGWDIVVVLVAVASPIIALATLVLVPLSWNGRRGTSIGIIALEIAAILPALPPFFHAPGELPAAAPISAAIGITLNLLTVGLIAAGMRRTG